MIDNFDLFCIKLNLPEKTRNLLNRIRTNPPSRNVEGNRHNVCGKYPSEKMHELIQFESHTNELAAIYHMEHDPNVLEFYDQPEPIRFEYQTKDGKNIAVNHTPDFLVIREDWIGWEEWKTENKLLALSQKSPNRYVKTDEGWKCPPGEAFAAQFGLSYALRSSAELDQILVRNITFLEDYLIDER